MSTDLYVKGRGISLLVNVLAGEHFTYALTVDRGKDAADKHHGTVGAVEAPSKQEGT